MPSYPCRFLDLTISRKQADILRAFATFVRKGSVERKVRTMPWCASCKTVLAKAEIEYKTRLDPSCYVLFPLLRQHTHEVLSRFNLPLKEEDEEQQVSLLAWTTTPWTLPMNRALVLNPSGVYALVELHWVEAELESPKGGKKRKEMVLLGRDNLKELCDVLHLDEAKVLGEVEATFFAENAVHAHHPFVDGLTVPVVLDHMVALKEKKEADSEVIEDKERGMVQQKGVSTAVVHAAPGCGAEVSTYVYIFYFFLLVSCYFILCLCLFVLALYFLFIF